MILYTSTSTQEELKQILVLQQLNLPHNISSPEREKEGFVTVHHDLDILTRMHNICPHTIAKDGEKVIGYTLCMHPQFGSDIPVLRPMFRQIEKALQDRPEVLNSYIVMGQVCIDKAYRGQGVFRKLYEAMKAQVSPNFSKIITEVDSSNKRSLQAHYAIGFQLLKRYQSGGQDWEIILL